MYRASICLRISRLGRHNDRLRQEENNGEAHCGLAPQAQVSPQCARPSTRLLFWLSQDKANRQALGGRSSARGRAAHHILGRFRLPLPRHHLRAAQHCVAQHQRRHTNSRLHFQRDAAHTGDARGRHEKRVDNRRGEATSRPEQHVASSVHIPGGNHHKRLLSHLVQEWYLYFFHLKIFS